MAIRETKPFDITGIEKVMLQFADNTDVIQCVGNISGTTEMRTLTRTCKGVSTSIAKPQKLKVTATMYMPIETARDLYGLENKELKKGVYSYNASSKGKAFSFVARFKDDFSETEKMIAIPKSRTTSGLNFTADSEATDIAKITLEFEAELDELNNLYYEALIDEKDGITEQEAKKWEEQFTTDLVKMAS